MSNYKQFVTPHCHIESLDSASTPEAFAERELELGGTALTCTDHGVMGACRKVYNIAKKNNLTPILGLEAYFRPEGQCPILAKHGITGAELEHYYNEIYKYGHITMHAMDQVAYEALVKTLSKAHLNRAERHGSEVKPLFNWEDLEFLGQYNITMTSGCLVGIISRHLLKEERYDIALDYYERLRTIPKPGNFIVEVFPHKCTHKWENGVFVHFADGTKQKFYAKKKLRTENGELTAEELYRRSKTNKQLTGIKNRHKWDEFDPKEIAKVEFIEDFIQNECTSYAPDGDLQLPANKFLIALAERYGDSIIISDDSHFSHPEAYLIQTAKLRGAGGGGWPFHNSYHRMSSEEVAPHFLQYMGIPKAKFENWIDNGLNWASKFKDFKFSDSKQLPTSFYPKDSLGYLKTLIDKHGRMDWNDPVRVARLKQEIGWLHNNGTIDLLPYFFPPEEVMDLYNQKEVLSGPGRGSSAALLINYLLEITHVDPIEHDLPLERFITPDRIKSGKLPDVDMDFSDRSFIDDQENGWLKTRFGENAAKISTSVLMRVKSSIKDVARYKHGAVSEEIENLCKKMPNPIQGVSDWDQVFGYVGDDGKEVKGFIDTSPALQEYVAKYPDDWEIVKKMLGLSRTRSQHACAVVLADKKISDFIPLMKIGDSTCTQYTAESVEEAGGVKLDFLTISSLKDIGDTIKLVQSRYLEEPLDKTVYIDGVPTPRHRILPFENKLCDIWKLPEEQKVFNKVALGDTETVFQFNTASAKKWLKYFAHTDASGNPIIRSVHDMALFTALDRPGPLDALNSAGKNMLVEYSNRARGQPYTDSMEVLEELLPETLGVIAYQESLQKVYQNLTGCTGSEAEEFRSNAAKKKADKVLAAYPFFIERASEKIGREQAEQLWVQLQTFSQYGFCKAHAQSYAQIGYACAFLKYYYPLEWWCCVLQNAKKDEISEKFWKYCCHFVDMPDIRYSGENFEIHNDRIRAPLGFLTGVGEKAQIELARGRPYTNLEDFCRKIVDTKNTKTVDDTGKEKAGRSAVHSGIVTKLIVSGVMDSFFEPGSSINQKIDEYLEIFKKVSGKKPPKIDKAFCENLDQLKIFQIRKQILPIHSEPILQHVDLPNFTETSEGKYTYQLGKKSIPVLSGKRFKLIQDQVIDMHEAPAVVGIVGYVESDTTFNTKYGKAMKMVVDCDGHYSEFVQWARKDGVATEYPKYLTGSIVLLTLEQNYYKTSYSIGEVIRIRMPMDYKHEET